ncbi:MAG: fibronectin type III domain-containing protein [Bacteroidales bacterium]|nr:fibronectin type III domain-containing protein [Bacteroidales bacterium]
MKRSIIIAGVLALCTVSLRAQYAAYYVFEAANGTQTSTYTSLTGATELTGASGLPGVDFDNYAFISETAVKAFDDMMSDETQAGFPIGFTFNYGNKDFDRFMPTSEGYIALANGQFKRSDILPVGSHFAPYAIGLRGTGPTYHDAGTKVAYKLEGEAGHHILSVEFRNFYYTKKGANVLQGGLNYTIRLYEEGGKIEFYFGSMLGADGMSALDKVLFAIGLNVETDQTPDFQNHTLNYRQPGGRNGELDWNETSQVNYFPTAAQLMTNATIAVGTVWAFTKPAPCTTPDAAKPYISDMRPEGFRIDYDLTDVEADGFVTFVSETPLADDVQPENGTIFRELERWGSALCVGTEALDAEKLYSETPRISSGTDYYVYSWLYNERCAGLRTYGARGEALRLSAPEISMTYGNDQIALFPKGEDTLAVLVTSIYGARDMNDVITNVGRFGIPTASHHVGDTVWTINGEFGGILVYKNLQPAGAFTYAESLKPYANYHFAAFRRNDAGAYTSAFAQADTLTAPVIPFVDDFSTTIPSQEPSLYICENEDFIKNKTTGHIEASIAGKSIGASAKLVLETPELLFPQEADARLILDYNYTVEREDRQTPNLKAEDYAGDNGIRFSISADGVEWTQVDSITKTNPDLFASDEVWKQRYVTLPGFRGQRCRVRIEVTGEALERQAKMKIRTLSVVEKPDCDAPLSVSQTAGSVLADSASLTWVPFDIEQTQGTVAYRLETEDRWVVLCETAETALRVSGLPNRTGVVLGVKTRCTGGAESVYTESGAFLTGYQMPFEEDFSTPDVRRNNKGDLVYVLPDGWATGTDEISANGLLDLATDARMGFDAPIVDWNTHLAYDPQVAGNNAVRLGSELYVKESWVAMPPFILPETHTAVLSFDAALLHSETFAAATAATIAADAKLTVYATEMTGADKLTSQTFTANDIILAVDAAGLAEIGTLKHLEASLGQLSGKVRVGICYQFGTLNGDQTKYNQLYLDNIAVAEPCGAVADLHLTALDETSAGAAWRAYPNVTAYKVTVIEAENADAAPIEINVQAPQAEIAGLTAQTAYKLTVAYVCGDGESAKSEITFTTGGAPCDIPTDLQATEITKTSAVLTWSGQAETYRLEFKEASASAYTLREVKGTTFRLTNLNAGSSYSFRVRAVCNALAGDLSDWSETATFRTQSLTCIAPTGIEANPSFSLAEVTWRGEADNYEIAWRRAGETAMPWTTAFVAAETFTVSGLKAETIYHVRVRSICAAGDTSLYSDVVAFTTIAEPVCPLPTQLRVEDTTLTSARMAWNGNGQHEGYLFRYRETAVTVWDSVKNLTATTYALDNLKARTAYIWSVNALCSEGRTSGWAAANEFSTPGGMANEDVLRAGFEMYATKGHINILNRKGIYVYTIEAYAVDGRKLERYTVNTNENVLLPVSLHGAPVVVALQTEAGRMTYKILLP